MAPISHFEEIEAWRSARELVRNVYSVSRTGGLAGDFGLRDQLQRAAVSIMSNIAEGFERDTDADFRRFLFVAKASAGEVRSLLYVALDQGYIDGDTHETLGLQSAKVSRQIAGFIRYLEQKPTPRKRDP